MIMENLELIEKAIHAVIKETAWSITWNTLNAIKAYRRGVVAELEEYQFGWRIEKEITPEQAKKSYRLPKIAGIHGSCGYGSACIVADNFCSLSTCGGHGVDIEIKNGEIIFTPDAEASCQSWGDLHEESEDFPIDDETRRFRRTERLKKALL